MLRQGAGAIVNTSSGSGLVGLPNSIGDAAAKHGMVGLTRSAALAYAQPRR
jgi:NAD(P)-dependent dehydrogenase (short-subunit alcohol dehydrogenase family)